MSDIQFNCPHCNQSIGAPEVLAGELVDCPTCKETIEVPLLARPADVELSASPQPPRVSPASGSTPPQPIRRHSVFYYVFWGTVSLFGTLAILLVGIFFLSAFGAGFFTASRGHTASTAETIPAARKLPALTESEAQEAQKLIGDLVTKRDEIEGITWYKPLAADGYKTAVYLYIGKKGTGEPWLRWGIRYYGDNWLFIHSYRIKIDEAEAATLLPTEEIKRDNSGESLWEIFDEPACTHAHLLNQILASRTTRLRMEETRGVKDITLESSDLGLMRSDLAQMRDVLLVYRYLGGTWPEE
jgi:hypothetical protein